MTSSRRLATSWRAIALGFVVGALAVGTAGRSLLAAPQEPRTQQAADVLPALLTEVRGLRAAMEQMASAGPRIQLSVARLQIEEGRINSMNRRLDDIRSSITNTQHELREMVARQAEFEAAANTHLTGPDHDQAAGMAVRAKQAVDDTRAEIARLTAEDGELSQQIATEQARWADISRRLDELERTLERK